MKKLLLVVAATMALAACGDKANNTGTPNERDVPTPVATGPAKTKAEIKAELVAFQAACKADPKLWGCSENADKMPVVGTAKTKAEVSAELAAFLAACKANPKADGCNINDGQ